MDDQRRGRQIQNAYLDELRLASISSHVASARPALAMVLRAAKIGLPRSRQRKPIGVQLIAAPWREDLTLRVAGHLHNAGVATAPVASLP